MKQHKSLLTDNWDECYFCEHGVPAQACHHIFGGPNRSISEREGFTVPLCHAHHNMSSQAVHFNRPLDLFLKRLAQTKYEEAGHTREQFIKLIGRSYL